MAVMAQNRKPPQALRAAARRIDIGSGQIFSDIPFVLEMKDYRKMSKAELLTWIEKFKSNQARRTRSQRQQAASALRDSAERLRAILETAVEGIITIDERGIIESFNLGRGRNFRLQATEVIGKNVSILMPSPHREQHDAYLANYLHTGHAKIIGIGREVVGRRKDGTVFPMDLSVSEVRLADRRLFTGFIRDITERKRLEKEILEISEREQPPHRTGFARRAVPASGRHRTDEPGAGTKTVAALQATPRAGPVKSPKTSATPSARRARWRAAFPRLHWNRKGWCPRSRNWP